MRKSTKPHATAIGKAKVRDAHTSGIDSLLLVAVLSLLAIGLVMVASASMTVADRQLGQPFYYIVRQALFVGIGLCFGVVMMSTSLDTWHKYGTRLLFTGIFMLVLVLMPGIGREINGSTRWLSLGIFNLQPSELVKLFVVMYLPGYLVRHNTEVRTSISGLIKPMALLLVICALLLLEPDFGAAAVILVTGMGIMFLGGVRFAHFTLFMTLILSALAALALSSPYRVERLTTFLNPWSDPFNSGFQLTQALIAFGRGEVFGVGIGDSVQKLFYLPESHTDFLLAVLAEEAGLFGVLLVIGLFTCIVVRSFVIARQAEQQERPFAAYLAYGIGIWIGLQAFINIGVNMGILPTKGLTLPLMSYGGSSIVVSCMAMALLLRIHYELNRPEPEATSVSYDFSHAGGRPA